MPRTGFKTVAVAYLARGVEADHLERIARFASSYRKTAAGLNHQLYVVYKGFSGRAAEEAARAQLGNLPHIALNTADDSLDLGAYAIAVKVMMEDAVCFLNTNSIIMGDDWLLKLALNLAQVGIGAVSASASYESLSGTSVKFFGFPNPHLRSNAFMMRRRHASECLSSVDIKSKLDAYMLESGPSSITRTMMQRGLVPLVVGRNGRGYGMEWWPSSQTFRQGLQENLLVHDNVTLTYERAPMPWKRHLNQITWGDGHQPVHLLARSQ